MESSALVPDQIDAIVFDVIGTLVDEDGTWQAVAELLAAEAGVDDGTAPLRPHRQLVTDSARDAITQAGADPSPAALELVQDLDSPYPAWPDVAPHGDPPRAPDSCRRQQRRSRFPCAAGE